MSVKIVINDCFGAFGLSTDAFIEYKKRKDMNNEIYREDDDTCILRNDPILVDMVEIGDTDGYKINGAHAKLIIKRVPASWVACWKIAEYDGLESVQFDSDKCLDNVFDQITNLLDSDFANDEKLLAIKNVLEFYKVVH